MGKIRALRSQDVNPAIVLQSLQDVLPDIEQIYVVAMMKDEPAVWATGDLGQLCHAAVLLQDFAADWARGRMEGE